MREYWLEKFRNASKRAYHYRIKCKGEKVKGDLSYELWHYIKSAKMIEDGITKNELLLFIKAQVILVYKLPPCDYKTGVLSSMETLAIARGLEVEYSLFISELDRKNSIEVSTE